MLVTEWIRCEPQEAYDGASATDTLPDIFKGSGAVPGVISAHMEREAEGVTRMTLGETRVVLTADGKTVRETYTIVDPPRQYQYQMTDLNPPLSAIMSRAVGTWSFELENGGTRVNWRYEAFPTAGIARPATALVTKGFLKSAMQDCLAKLKTMVELELPPRWVADDARTTCQTCDVKFGAFTRRHHCRACAGLFCAGCSGKAKALPQFGIAERVRVCDSCFAAEPAATDRKGDAGGSKDPTDAASAPEVRPVSAAAAPVSAAAAPSGADTETPDAGPQEED